MKKQVSIFLLTFFLLSYFSFGFYQREVKAIVPVLVAPVVASGATAIAYALLYGSDIAFDWSGKAYNMATDLVHELGENAFNVTTGALVVGDMTYNAIQNVINKYKTQPVQNIKIQEVGISNGQFTKTLPMSATFPSMTTPVEILMTPGEQLNLSLKLERTYNTPVTATNIYYTVPSNATSVKFQFRIESKVSARYSLNLTTYLSDGTSTYTTVWNRALDEYAWGTGNFGDISCSLNFNNTNDYMSERSVSLDYTGQLNDSSVDKVKTAYPIGASISANPSATWSTPMDLGISAPIATDLVDVTIPTVENPPLDIPLDYTIPGTVTLDFTPLQISLKDKFPFSIPWDILNSFNSFANVSSTPPKWTLDFTKLPGGTTLTIDLAQFNKLATVSRWGIMLIFSYVLMIKTRDIIGG